MVDEMQVLFVEVPRDTGVRVRSQIQRGMVVRVRNIALREGLIRHRHDIIHVPACHRNGELYE